MQQPRRRYRNFAHFCLACGCSFGNPYPCLACHGDGCPACHGSGKGTRKACRQTYQKILQAYRQEKADYNRLVRCRKEALQRLTKERNPQPPRTRSVTWRNHVPNRLTTR